MELTRRRLLAAGGAAAAGLTGGCMSALPFGPSGPVGTTPTSTPTDTPTATPTATPSVSEADSGVEQVFLELEWFARQYRPTVDRYLSRATRTLSLLEALANQSSVSGSDMDRLRSQFDELERIVYDQLGPHFDTEPTIRAYNDERLQRLETLRSRGDWDALQSALSEMAAQYTTWSTETYVARTFPVDPIGGRFARLLTASGQTGEAGIAVYHAPTNHLSRVQADATTYDGELPGSRVDIQQYQSRLGPVDIVAFRTSRAYLTYTAIGYGNQSEPVYIQQYRDADAARGAIRRMLSESGGVTAEGTESLGSTEWRRIFYRANNELTYAHLLRSGRYVLTAAPSRRAWDERGPDWTAPLSLAWFWE